MIDHKILFSKLASWEVNQKAAKWFDPYLSDRHQKC